MEGTVTRRLRDFEPKDLESFMPFSFPCISQGSLKDQTRENEHICRKRICSLGCIVWSGNSNNLTLEAESLLVAPCMRLDVPQSSSGAEGLEARWDVVLQLHGRPRKLVIVSKGMRQWDS